MSSRKRRSNRLTADQLAACRDQREERMNQVVALCTYGQEHLPFEECFYRSVSLRVVLRMMRDGDAAHFEAATANGTILLFRETKPAVAVKYNLPTLLNRASAEALAASTPGARLSGRQLELVRHATVYPFIGDTKAPLVMPRVSDRDREAAAALLAEGKRPATAGHCYRSIGVWRAPEQAAA